MMALGWAGLEDKLEIVKAEKWECLGDMLEISTDVASVCLLHKTGIEKAQEWGFPIHTLG